MKNIENVVVGDSVVLIDTSSLPTRLEVNNWMRDEKTCPKVGDVFKVATVERDSMGDAYVLGLEGLSFLHRALRFKPLE